MRPRTSNLVKILDTLESAACSKNTFVVAERPNHGGDGHAPRALRQEDFNPSTRNDPDPLVYSNPPPFSPAGAETLHRLHVDFPAPPWPVLPSTRPRPAPSNWQGVDYSDQILGRSPAPQNLHRLLPTTTLAVRAGHRALPEGPAQTTIVQPSREHATRSPPVLADANWKGAAPVEIMTSQAGTTLERTNPGVPANYRRTPDPRAGVQRA